jgi:NADH dehydrogenase
VAARKVILLAGELSYDYLIVATGATHSYFGNDAWEPVAPGLKTIEDALQIRRRVLFAFEAAEREPDEAERRAWLTFVVVGGGPTGVEVAGALAEVARSTLKRDFRHIDPAAARILLVEGGPRILPPYPPALSASAAAQLRHLGAEVEENAKVVGIDARGVSLADGQPGRRIEARTVIWAAGVTASPIGASLGAPLDRAGRVEVTPILTVPGHDEVQVIGDLASVKYDGKSVPGVAPAAIQMGRYAARAIVDRLRGRTPAPFRYHDKGSLATIGRSAAVADFGRFTLRGFWAWLAWLGVHIFFLIGFRNRLLVMIEWAWAYLTYQRGARLITGEIGQPALPATDGLSPDPRLEPLPPIRDKPPPPP